MMKRGPTAAAVIPTTPNHPVRFVSLRVRLRRLWGYFQAHQVTLALAGILLAGAALRLWMLARDVPTLDSDEATIGLMALHLQHGELTAFMWGQQYMGSLEAMLIAPFLWLFGPSSFTLRLAPMLIGLAGIATTYRLGMRLYSQRVGLLSALLLALSPPFFVVLSVRAYGGYVETLLFGNLLLLLALRGADPARRSRRGAMLLGLVAGLALWTNLLILPYLLVVVVLSWLARRADLVGRNCIPLLGGLLLGASPAIIANIFNGAATISTILGLTVVGARQRHTATNPLSILQHFWQEVTIALPILTGGFLGGTQAAGLKISDYLAQAAAHPMLYALALYIALAAVALFLRATVRLLHSWRTLRLPKPVAEGIMRIASADEAVIRQQGRAALVLVTLCYFVAFFLGNQPDIAATPRYLFPLFAVLPVLVAELLSVVESVASMLAKGGRHIPMIPKGVVPRERLITGVFLAVIILALCGWNLAGDIAVTPVQTAARDHNSWIAGQDQQVLHLLLTHHIHTVISNDYWEGLRLTFESHEAIIVVMVTPQGHPGFNRYHPYVVQGLTDPRPAYLELTGTPEAALALERLHSGKLPRYSAQVISSFTVLIPS